nr:biopolymer transporter ExbD [uncultured Desulfobacter sp.]
MIQFTKRSRESAEPDITPLLDMVFILLIFFIIAATFAIHGIDMHLPTSSNSRTYAGKPIEIVLTAEGTLKQNNDPITLHDLTFIIKANAQKEDRQILLIPDRDARVGAFMETINTIRNNGGDRLVIATQPSAPPKGMP